VPYASLLRIFLPAAIILAAIIFAILRLGSGAAAVTGLGYLPPSLLSSRLRRFLFGECQDIPAARKNIQPSRPR
jgi:hypothetical protein